MLIFTNDQMDPQSKRPCVEKKTWARLLSCDSEFPVYVMHEKPSIRLINMLKDFYTDNDEVVNYSSMLDNILKASATHTGMKVIYQQNDYSKLIESGSYDGAHKIGRSFSKCGVTKLSKSIRNTLYKTSHFEMDIVNCNPTIAVHYFGHLRIPALKSYVNEKDYVMAKYSELGVSGGFVKRAINTILSSFPSFPTTLGLPVGEVDAIRTLNESDMIRAIKEESMIIGKDIEESYSGFYKMVQAKVGVNGRPGGASFSMFAQDVEHSILRCIVKHIDTSFHGRAGDIILNFDGYIIPKTVACGDIPKFCADMEALVQNEIGVCIKFSIKSMETPSMAICIPEAEIDLPMVKSYDTWKTLFEMDRWTVRIPFSYVWKVGNTLQYFSQSKFLETVKKEPEEYIKQWISDLNQKEFIREVFSPFPRSVKENEYNRFTGLQGGLMDPLDISADERSALLDPVLNHVESISGGKEYAEYVLNWLAQRIQVPGDLPGVVLGFRSVQGTGKDIFFDSFFGKNIIGSSMFLKKPRAGDVFSDGRNACVDGKVFILLSECARKDTIQCLDLLKNFIAAPTVQVRRLYQEEQTINNCAGIVMLSNDFQFINVDPGDRRFAIFQCSSMQANNSDHFGPLYSHFSKKDVQRCFYEFLLNRDISMYNASRDRPSTRAGKSMATFSKPPFDMFMSQFIGSKSYEQYGIKDGIVSIPCSSFRTEFMDYLKSREIVVKIDKRMTMMSGIEFFNASSEKFRGEYDENLIRKKKVRGQRIYDIYLKGVKQYIATTQSEDDDGVDDEDDDGRNAMLIDRQP